METEILQTVDQMAIERSVDELYGAAVDRFPTYETVVHRAFCKAMLQTFPDTNSERAVIAFGYAKGEYGYLTPGEIEKEDTENADDGICSHGLDFWTCPRGCFG